MSSNFIFSVLMPIYNVEKYLAESIDSLINQSIGFEENIELVIVDDGSPDNSKEIALKYQEKYPNNIKVFSKSNGGQASAFNFGLKHLNGKYVSFLDSDDCLSSNALFEVYDFFEKHYNELIRKPKYCNLIDKLDVDTPVEDVHNGYFSQDKKGVFKCPFVDCRLHHNICNLQPYQ